MVLDLEVRRSDLNGVVGLGPTVVFGTTVEAIFVTLVGMTAVVERVVDTPPLVVC